MIWGKNHRPFGRHLSVISGVFSALSLSGCAFGGMKAPDQGRLLSSAGVSQIEGTSGAGLSSWATITGYGSRDSYGATAFASHVELKNFDMQATGGAIGFKNRVELSYAHQKFNLNDAGPADDLDSNFDLTQNVIGAKFRVAGDLIYDQDLLLPQIAVGAQYKFSGDKKAVLDKGAASTSGIDVYASATKVFLDKSLLLSATLRGTRANQLGLLGFGSRDNTGYSAQFEGSAVYMLRRDLVIGADYRTKPDNLESLNENDGSAAYIAWFPNKSLSLSAAAVDMGEIANRGRQRGLMVSIQTGF